MSAPGPVASVSEAIVRMQQIESSLPPEDGVACFNRMYLDVTEQVDEQLSQGGFADASFASTLDVVFANLYFAAVDAAGAGTAVPTAWKPLFDARGDSRIYPIQFALAGMNAHINHDLPAAVVQTCAQLATEPDAGSHHADYQKVDVILDRAEQSIRQSFESGEALATDRSAQTVIDLLGNWTINSARDVAWDTALVLWRCRQVATVEDLLLGGVAVTVATASHLLLLPVRHASSQEASGLKL
jgi:hypothetical protein